MSPVLMIGRGMPKLDSGFWARLRNHIHDRIFLTRFVPAGSEGRPDSGSQGLSGPASGPDGEADASVRSSKGMLAMTVVRKAAEGARIEREMEKSRDASLPGVCWQLNAPLCLLEPQYLVVAHLHGSRHASHTYTSAPVERGSTIYIMATSHYTA